MHSSHGLVTCIRIMVVSILGLKDYENALKLDPGNEELRADAEKIRHTIQTETVS